VIVVADAGPLIYLDGIGKLDLLPALYGRVLVPRRVFEEVVVEGAGLPGAAGVAAAGWLEVVDIPADDLVYAALRTAVDSGEAAAIALAARTHADVVLIDDRAGRLAATQLGLLVRGTLAILVEAKRRGHVDAVKPLIARMHAAGFRATPAIVAAILELASET
jgi:predicted nucleic acid-binding protein